MDFDPEFLKKLTETFQIELDEHAQSMTDGLLSLEKPRNDAETKATLINSIFRSAHNIKGAARGIGAKEVADIAHAVETLFSGIQNKKIGITPTIISRCLDAVDKMQIAMKSFKEATPLPFSLEQFLSSFALPEGNAEIKKEKPEPITIPEPQVEKTPSAPPKKQSESVRVDINSIDKISALMEELQTNKIVLEEYSTKLNDLSNLIKQFNYNWKKSVTSFKADFNPTAENVTKLYQSNNDVVAEIGNRTEKLQKSMRAHMNELTILSNSLQEEIRMLRLVPAATFLKTLPRIARDLAQELHKKIDVIIEGEDVKVDKMILEGLHDPIIHLLRNAIDHGIESPEDRSAKRKNETGTIEISIRDEGHNIVITIQDDGNGIDVKKIAKAAEAKNLLTSKELANLSESDLLDFIFRPGFTTKENVSDISGRGVGLDVVKANLTNLKGDVRVTTKVGEGTTFYLTTPLTLTSEHGLLVRSSDNFFVIPTASVDRIIATDINHIATVENNQVILVEGHPIPLRNLSDILKLEREETKPLENLSIIIIKNAWQTLALLVDEIIGEREIVIKPLQPPLNHIRCVTGGTLSGNGQVIIVLDNNDVINMAFHIGKMTPLELKQDILEIDQRAHILVVDDSITTRTLEQNILENQGYNVTVAVNGKEAWDLLQKQEFALVITDISMPIMDGFTLTEQIKQSEKLNRLPVIIVTSLGSDAEKKRGLDAGANAYIIKNEFESGELLEIINQLV